MSFTANDSSRAVGTRKPGHGIEYRLEQGWLLRSRARFRESETGQLVARPLLNGPIRLRDRGHGSWKFALKMPILRSAHDGLAHPLEDNR